MKLSTKLIPLSALLAIGLLAGCGKGDGKTHVTFWHTMGQANQDILDRMIQDFQASNPDIVIDAFSQGGYDDIAGKLNDAIPAGTTPTMSFCYPDNVASYLESGAIEDMTDYVNNAEYGFTSADPQSDFVKSYWDEGCNYQQKGVFSLPYAKSTEVIFYNKTAFDENGWTIPTTWDEMWALCKVIKETIPTVKYPLGYDSDSNLFITMCEQRGIPYTTKEGSEKADHFLFNNDQAKAMVQELKGYYDKGYIATKGTQANSTYTSTMFTNVELLMSIGSTGGTTYNKTSNFQVGVAPIPSGSKNGHVVSQGPSICFFKRASSAEKVAAWKFYKHITSTDNSATFAIRTGYEPVRTSSYSCPQYTSYIAQANKNLLAAAAVCTKENYANRYFASDVFNGSDTARDEVGAIISNVLLGTKSIDQAFKDALTNCLFTG